MQSFLRRSHQDDPVVENSVVCGDSRANQRVENSGEVSSGNKCLQFWIDLFRQIQQDGYFNDIFIIICTLSEGLGSQNHLYRTRIMDNITYELDACVGCQNYEPGSTYSLRACSVGYLRHDIRELKRVLVEALRTYEFMTNMRIEEEERNGMFTDYKHQTAFNGNTVSWMRAYEKFHIMLHEISLNMTVMELLLGQRLVTNVLHYLRAVMCQLQAALKLGSFAEEDMHLQVTCRRSFTISRDIENARSTNLRINFSIHALLTARDALNEIYDVIKSDTLWRSLQF